LIIPAIISDEIKGVSGMFEVIQIDGVIDYSLHIAFIVTDGKIKFESVISHLVPILN